MQDNGPKNTFNGIIHFIDENRVDLWKTLHELPDCNPIENLQHKLKKYFRREVKPSRKEDLVAGIVHFWELWIWQIAKST